LNYQTWEDKQSGQQRSKLEVVANNVQFLTKQGDKKDMGSGSPTVSDDDDVPF